MRTLGGGAGLVAATQGVKEAPVWVVTGTDDAGVRARGARLQPPTLADRFAVALSAGAIALPGSPERALTARRRCSRRVAGVHAL